MTSPYWEGRGNCPKCGKFCGNITASRRENGLAEVTGKCKDHGEVDLSRQAWSFDEFFSGEDD